MNKLIEILGKKIIDIATVLFFAQFVVLILLAYSPFERLNSLLASIIIILCLIYSIIVVFKIIKYKLKNKL